MKTIHGDKVDIVSKEAEIMLHTYNNIYSIESKFDYLTFEF